MQKSVACFLQSSTSKLSKLVFIISFIVILTINNAIVVTRKPYNANWRNYHEKWKMNHKLSRGIFFRQYSRYFQQVTSKKFLKTSKEIFWSLEFVISLGSAEIWLIITDHEFYEIWRIQVYSTVFKNRIFKNENTEPKKTIWEPNSKNCF